MRGFPHNIYPALQATTGARFGEGTGNIVLDDVQCTGSETTLFNCTHDGLNEHNCGHAEDAGVVCAGNNVSYYT